MSLKSRLRISIVTLVTLFVLAECVLSLRLTAEDKFRDAVERAQAIADQVRHLVLQRLNEQARRIQPAPVAYQEWKALFQNLVENDSALPDLLTKTMASSTAAVEIMVCDDAGIIRSSSAAEHARAKFLPLPDFMQWKTRSLLDRLLEVFTQSRDYAILVPLTLTLQNHTDRPILIIRVVVSSVLIKEAIVPQIKNFAVVSLLSLLASIPLAYLFSNALLRSVDRLSQRIESIATGQFTEDRPGVPKGEAKEFADMQSKLNVLSQQFRGAKEDMTQLRNNIERMLERLEEGVLLFDPSHRLMRASRSAEQILGMDEPLLPGQRLEQIFPASTPLGGLLREAIEQQRPIRDHQLTVEHGASGPVRLLVNVELLESFPEAGKFSVMLTLRDAETRRQLRSELDISTRLAAISRLTGGVAHEIKNPLNAMALHLEILKSKLEGDVQVEKELNVIGGEISRLDRVVKTFIDFTRPVELELKDIDMVDLARQVASLVWPEAERSGVSVELDARQKHAGIRGDEDLVKQALLNVVNNGIEAMQDGGQLLIHVEREGDEVFVAVQDQGPGIPEEIRDKIFNLYFTTKPKGSGIGLAMTFRIIQLHNATMDFSSKPGEGTTFRMRFPVADADGSEPEATKEKPTLQSS
jgi:hypothetical protein